MGDWYRIIILNSKKYNDQMGILILENLVSIVNLEPIRIAKLSNKNYKYMIKWRNQISEL